MGYRAATCAAARHPRRVHRVGRFGGGAGPPPARGGGRRPPSHSTPPPARAARARHRPAARIVPIDSSDTAREYARRNAQGTAIELLPADVTELASHPGLLAELDGRVDMLVANPPYVPD